jgi:putative thioredoxin
MNPPHDRAGNGGGFTFEIPGAPAGGAAKASRAEPVKDISTAEFAREVIEASRERPVVIDFWAPWCGPCRQLGPVLEKAVAARRGAVKLVKMNIDNHPEIASRMGVQSIPAVVAFVAGQPRDAFMGNVPESEVNRFLDRIGGAPAPSPADALLEEAEQLIEHGQAAAAADRYSAVLAAEPENVRALVGLGQLYLDAGDVERARGMLLAIPEAGRGDPRAIAFAAAIDLAERAADLGDAEQLMARIDANPKDFEARFDLALLMNSKNRREEAADQLLEIVRRDRKWRDDGARAQLLQFFEAWGPTDPATLSARRRLSSLLFA